MVGRPFPDRSIMVPRPWLSIIAPGDEGGAMFAKNSVGPARRAAFRDYFHRTSKMDSMHMGMVAHPSVTTEGERVVARNLECVRHAIGKAARRTGRDPAGVLLVGVTKGVSAPWASALFRLGVTHLAENRVMDARAKIEAVTQGPYWHLIGHLQRNKTGKAMDLFHRIDSVDNLALAQALSVRGQAGVAQKILVEINVSGESSKGGLALSDARPAIEEIARLPHLQIDGLMTMAPRAASEGELRQVFGSLRRLGAELTAEIPGVGPVLSMGMSNDFEIAVEEGANEVRIGSALFVGLS